MKSRGTCRDLIPGAEGIHGRFIRHKASQAITRRILAFRIMIYATEFVPGEPSIIARTEVGGEDHDGFRRGDYPTSVISSPKRQR